MLIREFVAGLIEYIEVTKLVGLPLSSCPKRLGTFGLIDILFFFFMSKEKCFCIIFCSAVSNSFLNYFFSFVGLSQIHRNVFLPLGDNF